MYRGYIGRKVCEVRRLVNIERCSIYGLVFYHDYAGRFLGRKSIPAHFSAKAQLLNRFGVRFDKLAIA